MVAGSASGDGRPVSMGDNRSGWAGLDIDTAFSRRDLDASSRGSEVDLRDEGVTRKAARKAQSRVGIARGEAVVVVGTVSL